MPTQEKKNQGHSTPKAPNRQDMPNKMNKTDKTKEMSHKRPSEVELPLRDETTHQDKIKKTRPNEPRTR